jgi:hypothetical protein
MMTEQQGGVEWEAGEALKLMVTGLIRFSEALRNGASSASAEQLIPMLLELRDVKLARQEDAASTEHVTGMLLDQAEIEQADIGRHAVQLALFKLALKDLTARVAALELR